MKERITCDLCGGTDFYNEGGNYYCSGCQTQTQEMHEHEFATEQTFVKTRIEKKKRADKSRKVTSWEYYNYILLGLSEELIDLGAEETLKPVVMFLWMHYLKQLQVISRDKNALPKIQLLNSAVDAEIIYGKPVSTFKRKRKLSSSSGSTVTPSSAHSRSMRKSKSLKALERSQSDGQQSEGDQYSLHNETLLSLQSNVSDSPNQNRRVLYNNSSSKELLKHQSKGHLRKHQEDYNKELKCHKISYLTASNTYRMGAHNLSLNKIYSIIYLALLINGDKIGLAEMLRFIKEGHLSFNRYDHFFPENYLGTNKLFGSSQRNVELRNEQFRVAVARVGCLLKVTGFIPQQNFLQLCEKYCKELNLPDEIHQYAKNILITLEPRMLFTAKSSTVPNYEARVLSVILIILKLIFCLDGKTEYEFSNFANDVNSRLKHEYRMFDIIAWLKYIEYRKITLTEHNFTAKFDNDKNFSESDLFVQFLQNKNSDDDDVIPRNLERIHHFLTILKDNMKRKKSDLSFPHTLTPFYDYTKIIVDEGVIEENGYLESVLNKDFVDDSLEFLMKPKKYLELVTGNGELEIISGGANENFVFEPVINCMHFKNTLNYFYNQKMLVNLNTTLIEDKNMSHIKVPDYDSTVRDTKTILRSYNSLHAKKFEKNKKKLAAQDVIDMNVDFKLSDVDNSNNNSTFKHFVPCERYWVKYRLHCWNEKEFEDFLSTLSTTFLIILKDCARICEQSVKQFYEEFQLTEIYIIYCSGLRKKEKVLAQPLKTLIQRAKNNW